MEGGSSKINPPNSHPSNPIHKAATQTPKPALKKTRTLPSDEIEETISEKPPQHEINKTAVIIGVLDVTALLFIALR